MKSIPLYNVMFAPGVLGDVQTLLASGAIASGPAVSRFEQLLGGYLGNPHVIGNSDISTALTLSLFQAGVRPGDEVIMSPLVCLATSCPARNLFANIRWCDVDPLTGNIAADRIGLAVGPRTRAIIVYHWAGNPADIMAIQAIARQHGLAVIEDAGEALGAEYQGRKIGATGSDYTVFSFYPNRHLTTLEGGAIACARAEDADELRRLRRYGINNATFRDKIGEINPESDIATAGWNSYMSNLAGTVGIGQISILESNIRRWQENGLYYDRELAAVPGVTVLSRPANSLSAYWVYSFLSQNRDELLLRLREAGVGSSRVHIRNDVYSAFGPSTQSLPGVDYFSQHCLSIPCGPWVSAEDRSHIVEIVRRSSSV